MKDVLIPFWNKAVIYLQHKEIRNYSIAYLFKSILILSLFLVIFFSPPRKAPGGEESHRFEGLHVKVGLMVGWENLENSCSHSNCWSKWDYYSY